MHARSLLVTLTRITKENSMPRGRNLSLVVLAGLQLIAMERLAAAPVPFYGQDTFQSWADAPTLTIARGTDIPVTLDVNVTLKRDQVGNTFPAHITRDLMVDGVVAIPAGAPAEVALVESEESPGAASFRLVNVSIGGRVRAVRTDVARADATGSGSSTGKKTGIGAIAGGALGLLVGGGSGLLKGAAVGAGGGLAWGLLDHGSRRVDHDTPLLFALRDPVQVSK